LRKHVLKWLSQNRVSREELAMKAGISRSTLGSWLNKPRAATNLDLVLGLSQGLGEPVINLLEKSGVLDRPPTSIQHPADEDQREIAGLLSREPLLRQLLVVLQSCGEEDLAVVLRSARGVAESSLGLTPSGFEEGLESFHCHRCGGGSTFDSREGPSASGLPSLPVRGDGKHRPRSAPGPALFPTGIAT